MKGRQQIDWSGGSYVSEIVKGLTNSKWWQYE